MHAIPERARSLTEPWAHLMVLDEKRFETRPQRSNFIGRWAVHASLSFPKKCRLLCEQEPFKSVLAKHGITSWRDLLPTLGHILGSVDQVGCLESEVFSPAYQERAQRQLFGGESGGPGQVIRRYCGIEPAAYEFAFGDYSEDRFIYITCDRERLVKPVPVDDPDGFHLGLWRVPPAMRVS